MDRGSTSDKSMAGFELERVGYHFSDARAEGYGRVRDGKQQPYP